MRRDCSTCSSIGNRTISVVYQRMRSHSKSGGQDHVNTSLLSILGGRTASHRTRCLTQITRITVHFRERNSYPSERTSSPHTTFEHQAWTLTCVYGETRNCAVVELLDHNNNVLLPTLTLHGIAISRTEPGFTSKYHVNT